MQPTRGISDIAGMMHKLTIHLPDDLHARLRGLARHRGVSLNKLMQDLALQELTAFDVETRFRAMAARGSAARGLAALDRLDALDDQLLPEDEAIALVNAAVKRRAATARQSPGWPGIPRNCRDSRTSHPASAR